MVLVTAQEAADILGVAVTAVYDLVRAANCSDTHGLGRGGLNDHAEIEAMSLSRLTRPQPRPHPYWASTTDAAAELGVTPSAVRQMMLADRLPYVTAPNGRRYVRRHQLDVIANVRKSRALEPRMEPPRSR